MRIQWFYSSSIRSRPKQANRVTGWQQHETGRQPDITFSNLEQELKQQAEPDLQQLAKDQFLAKLQSKRRNLTEKQQEQFEIIVGKSPEAFAEELRAMPPNEFTRFGLRTNSPEYL